MIARSPSRTAREAAAAEGGPVTTVATPTTYPGIVRPHENRAAEAAAEEGAATTVAILDTYPGTARSPGNNKEVMPAAAEAGNKQIVQQRHLHSVVLA